MEVYQKAISMWNMAAVENTILRFRDLAQEKPS